MRSTKAWRQVGTRRIQSTQQGTPTKRPNPHQGAEEHPGYCTKARKGRRAQEACEARPREGEESADEGRQPKVRRTGEPERGAGPKGPGSAGHTRGKNRTAEEEVAVKKKARQGGWQGQPSVSSQSPSPTSRTTTSSGSQSSSHSGASTPRRQSTENASMRSFLESVQATGKETHRILAMIRGIRRRREKANQRVVYGQHVSEVYSPPRVSTECERMGLLPGVAFDFTSTGRGGKVWDFSLKQRGGWAEWRVTRKSHFC